MQVIVVAAIVAALIGVVVLTELVAAIVPLLLIVVLVPPEQRPDLAGLLAAADSSRRLRLWRALRVAAMARRRERAVARASGGDRGEPFDEEGDAWVSWLGEGGQRAGDLGALAVGPRRVRAGGDRAPVGAGGDRASAGDGGDRASAGATHVAM